jgi:hypothetical protein
MAARRIDARQRAQGAQWKSSSTPDPLQAPAAQPAQAAHLPAPHCESLVHQQATPAAVQGDDGEATVLQLPTGHPYETAAEVTVEQLVASCAPLPLQLLLVVPLVHTLSALTHLPVEQSVSETHTHALLAPFGTGAGDSEEVQVAGGALHATEVGATSQPWPSSVLPLPVQLAQWLLLLLGMHLPVSQTASFVHQQVG